MRDLVRRLGWLAAALSVACGPAEPDVPPPPPAPAFAAEAATAPARDEPLNVVLVVIDTLRADHLEVYGYDRPTSSVLAARAAEWFIFENAQTAAPWTAPALITLMTSLYPSVHGILDFPIPERLGSEVITLAEVLQSRGYATGAFTEGGYAKGSFGLDQGFDIYPENPGDEDFHDSNLRYPSRIRENVSRALAWVDRNRDRPFFLFFHTYEPHKPYRAPEEFIQQFRPSYDSEAEHERLRSIIERWNQEREIADRDALFVQMHIFHCQLSGMPNREDPRQFRDSLGALKRSEELREWITDLYDAEIAYTDSQLARLWDEFDAGLGERTVVVLTADHGEGIGEHGRYGHGGNLFQEVLHIPLMLRVPGAGLSPRRITDVVRSIDVMPTVLELTGFVDRSLALQGRSLVPLLRGQSLGSLSFSHGRNQFRGDEDARHTVRDARWQLTEDFLKNRTWLYDLEHDPGESRDIGGQHADVVARLRQELRWQNERNAALSAALSTTVEASELSEETLEELRQLGYLGEEGM